MKKFKKLRDVLNKGYQSDVSQAHNCEEEKEIEEQIDDPTGREDDGQANEIQRKQGHSSEDLIIPLEHAWKVTWGNKFDYKGQNEEKYWDKTFLGIEFKKIDFFKIRKF